MYLTKQQILRMMGISLMVVICTLIQAGRHNNHIPQEGPWVVRGWFQSRDQVQALAEWIEPKMVDHETGTLIAEVDEDLYQFMLTLGFLVEVDVERTLELQMDRSIPSFSCYLTVEETFAFAQDIVANYPNLAEWIDVGDSWEKTQNSENGYDLMVLRLTNRTITGDKPTLFAMSGLHAREYAPGGLTVDLAQYLISNYGSDADATWLLDDHEIHLLLAANPDGRKMAESGQFWRKNKNNDFCPDSNSRGIDLNRNFEFMWGCCGGSSTNSCSETFRGPSPGSEPETQAVIDYIRSIFPDQRGPNVTDAAPNNATGVFLDIHSYGGCVLWPYGFDSTPTPNATIQSFGRKLAFFNGYRPEKASVSFDTDGTTDDFAYGDLGIAAFTFEVGTTFFQNCTSYNSTILPDNLEALIYAAKVSRTPYITPLGPDARVLNLSNSQITIGESATLTAIIDDTRYNNLIGTEPTQTVANAEYYIDTPPWSTSETPVPLSLAPSDGSFNSAEEEVTAIVDSNQLGLGKFTIYVRGQDTDGNWGAVSALFLEVRQDLSVLFGQWPGEVTILDMIPLVD